MSDDVYQSAEASNEPADGSLAVPAIGRLQTGAPREARSDDPAIETAIQALVQVALEEDDPVTALDDGAEALAEALAQRDLAEEIYAREAEERRADDVGAYRHARLHRVSELIDLGYQLDEAIGITKANEAEVRTRAEATGRDAMDVIYEYAVRNGYRSAARQGTEHRSGTDRAIEPMEALAAMSDEAFAEARETMPGLG
jgi:hypothetical protein